MDRLRAKINDLENELSKQKDQYSRKQTQRSNPGDPELERLRSYIR